MDRFSVFESLTEKRELMDLLSRIGDAITRLMGKNCEIAIHDFYDMNASLVYLKGEVTGRKIGAPVSSELFRLLNKYGDKMEDRVNYRMRLQGGRIVRSSTTFIRNEVGTPIGCFCVNYDVTELLNMRDMLQGFALFEEQTQTADSGGIPESSSTDFIDAIVEQAVTSLGKQPAYMSRAERVEMVRMLENSGVFRLKGAVEYVARVMGVTRFSVYNYLKEIKPH